MSLINQSFIIFIATIIVARQNGFTIVDIRTSSSHFDMKLSFQFVTQNFQMQFSDSSQNGLSTFFIGIYA